MLEHPRIAPFEQPLDIQIPIKQPKHTDTTLDKSKNSFKVTEFKN